MKNAQRRTHYAAPPSQGVQSDLLGSDLERGILGNWLLFSLVGASQGQQAAWLPDGLRTMDWTWDRGWSGSLVSQGTRAGVLVSPPAARKEKPLSKGFGFTR